MGEKRTIMLNVDIVLFTLILIYINYKILI
ncbi:uncharacterized protein METZ01_LOCUS122851 [marine metagenome]|uniref:Uncharacterized protein n=1 Tax=marine metagenome TaxID=408172 RepID=A0A381Y0M4_9ZZZZ